MPPASARDGGREVATGPATATKAAGEPGTAATTTARRARVGAAAAGPGERGAGREPGGPRPGPLRYGSARRAARDGNSAGF